MSKCKEFWEKNLFTIYDKNGEDVSDKRNTTKKMQQGDLFGVKKEKLGDFKKLSKECATEAASQVSIPTASGIAAGATTLGVGGGIAGVYLIPKLIKLFVG